MLALEPPPRGLVMVKGLLPSHGSLPEEERSLGSALHDEPHSLCPPKGWGG